jgi:SAM-dependent methyltransferase
MQLHGVVSSSPVPCPVCGAKSPLLGVVDFHKSCLEAKNLRLSLSGVPIYYRQCSDCRFAFTDAFDDWSPEDFARHIYNENYALVDPDYADSRPYNNVQLLDILLDSEKPTLRLIDYGGGNGKLAECMRIKGYIAETFDPFSTHNIRPAGAADVVTAFEVMEHSNRPHAILEDMVSLLKPDGLILFSTVLQPADFDQMGINWWYIGPRNGHVSIYSRAALVTINDNLHLALRGVPKIVENILKNMAAA